MIVNNDMILYPRNPFSDKDCDNDSLLYLNNPVQIYSMPVDIFEPVINFIEDSDGKYKLEFGHEWIARKPEVEVSCETITVLPKEIFDRKNIFFESGKSGFDYKKLMRLCKSKKIQEAKEYLKSLIDKGIIVYANEMYKSEYIQDEYRLIKPIDSLGNPDGR